MSYKENYKYDDAIEDGKIIINGRYENILSKKKE